MPSPPSSPLKQFNFSNQDRSPPFNEQTNALGNFPNLRFYQNKRFEYSRYSTEQEWAMSSLALNPARALILIKRSIWMQIDIDICNLFDTLSSHGEIAKINHFLTYIFFLHFAGRIDI
jgi:hypothetical protein